MQRRRHVSRVWEGFPQEITLHWAWEGESGTRSRGRSFGTRESSEIPRSKAGAMDSGNWTERRARDEGGEEHRLRGAGSQMKGRYHMGRGLLLVFSRCKTP